MAVNDCDENIGTEGFTGVTAIETNVAAVTVRMLVPLTKPDVAVIVVTPVPAPVARPFEPGALLTVAAAGSSELHVTDVVRSCVDVSL